MMNQTKLFAVTGNPVLHSKSPPMFNRQFTLKEKDAAYFRMAASSADEAVRLFRLSGLSGMNVTAPFKKEIMGLLDWTDPEANKIGAVNTITEKGGRLLGYNTDHIGVTGALSESGFNPEGKKCTVVGGGGAGRAAVYGLVNSGARVTVIDIDEKTAAKTAGELDCSFAVYSSLRSYAENSDLLVYATDTSHKAVDPDWLKEGQVIFDVNYKGSLFEDVAREKGCRLVGGLQMLLNQAIPAYKYFLNDHPDIESMREALEEERETKKNVIALTGFMGTGKSATGKKLAEMLGYDHVETDLMIEKKAGCSISEIFSSRGEDWFRNTEEEVIREAISGYNLVVSCGGGAILSPSNRSELKKAVTVWLYCSTRTGTERANDGTRPLLNVENPLEQAGQLMLKRKGFYARSCDLMVSTEDRAVGSVAKIIEKERNSLSQGQ